MNLKHINYHYSILIVNVVMPAFLLSRRNIWCYHALLGTTLASIFLLSIIHKNAECNYSSMPIPTVVFVIHFTVWPNCGLLCELHHVPTIRATEMTWNIFMAKR